MTAIDVDKNWQLLINGEWIDPAEGTYDVIDPATTQVVGHAPEASVEQALGRGRCSTSGCNRVEEDPTRRTS